MNAKIAKIMMMVKKLKTNRMLPYPSTHFRKCPCEYILVYLSVKRL
jgi:hypothetical protein